MSTNVGDLKSNINTNQLEDDGAIKASDKYVSAVVAMIVMDHYEAKALMRFSVGVSLNNFSAKADTIIDTIT